MSEGASIVPRPGAITVADIPDDEKGELILPYGVGGKPDVGIVVKVGLGVELGLEPGDKVFYGRGHCHEVEDVKVVDQGCVIAYDDSGRSF